MSVDIRILILNTSLADSAPIERELQKVGVPFATREIKTRPELIEALRESPSPDLLLNQCLFPEYDGLSALQLARNLAPALPFVMLADAKDNRAAQDCLAAGAALFITPDDYEPLASFVRQCYLEKGGALLNAMKPEETSPPIKPNEKISTVELPDAQEKTRRASETTVEHIYRRLNSDLRIVSSLLFLEARELQQTDDRDRAVSIFNRSRARIKTLALVYEHLAESKSLAQLDFRVYVTLLINALCDLCNAPPDAVQDNTASEVLLDGEHAALIGLITCEALLDALADVSKGETMRILIDATLNDRDEITICVEKKCADERQTKKTPDETNGRRLSLRLIEMLAEELQASLELNNEKMELRLPSKKVHRAVQEH